MRIKRLPYHIAFISLIAGMLTSCTTTNSLYSWYNYDNVTYNYNKKQTENLKIKILKEYQTVIKNQYGTRNTVPPGMNAEYGYLLYMSGKEEEGISYLKEEIKLYPESEKYISRIIKQLEK